ncbi:16S rRNA (cytosine(1402)-N(4))-methyltransferase RsmH [Candidatus Parcubacteria bacterium]|nr:16S rRNA (cytosine(1402)-N(4))-methyltransferase RsmH [Candidatus Parcubacteria bacterium]
MTKEGWISNQVRNDINIMNYQHIPVMLKEVLEYLDPQPGQYFIDCTLGGAGYTIAIAERVGEKGGVIAIDLDKMAIENAKLQITNYQLHNIILVQDNFKNLSKIAKQYFKNKKINGIVFDLGLSSAQLKDRNRGFSFQKDALLDMAFGQSEISTIDIINKWKKENLEKIIREYGEERFAKRIAQGIVDYRKIKLIKTTGQLVEIIKSVIPKKYQHGKIHFATRTFQALRIATNNELENLREVLPQAVDLLIDGGRIVVISYHSLEDRIVKRFFKQESKDCICPPNYPACRCQHKARIKILTKKVIRAREEEVRDNPGARSAKLRAVEKI